MGDNGYREFQSLDNLISALQDLECTTLLIKILAENDNSKNQVYFGPNFGVLNQIPIQEITADQGGVKGSIFKGSVDFAWMNSDGTVSDAAAAQLIFYPQYPEVRFSGFLKGAKVSPSALMIQRLEGRVLIMGITVSGRVIGHVVSPDSTVAREINVRTDLGRSGVFRLLSLTPAGVQGNSRQRLLKELSRVHKLGWIQAKKLKPNGTILPCNAPHCGGLTLEAELGIPESGDKKPDFYGWELKSYKVNKPDAYLGASPLTLMTPGPSSGFYHQHGVVEFVKKFGYKDKKGRPDRMNFGGVYKVGIKNSTTGLTLRLRGFDGGSKKITDASGSIDLRSTAGTLAARWDFTGMMDHWTKKHAQAAYVSRVTDKEPSLRYKYGNTVGMAEGTDFLRFLSALDDGLVYYDPGIKVTDLSTDKPKTKPRNQFRVRVRDVINLYSRFDDIRLT